jgi:DNA invertase Pin-like site-specific DNA recombinase
VRCRDLSLCRSLRAAGAKRRSLRESTVTSLQILIEGLPADPELPGHFCLAEIPRTVAYLRVSTVDQDTEKNWAAILALANHKRLGHVEFVEEKVSGTVSWRSRRIAAILEEAGKGDTIVVSELSRLGRSMLECMEILSIAAQKGISIYAVKGDWQLPNTIQSKILAMAFSRAAEIERDLISKRTREALIAKKEQGLRLGRPRSVGK